MSGDPYRKVQAGDPLAIPAETFNTFIDMALDWKGRRLGQSRDIAPGWARRGSSRSRTRQA